MKSFNSKFYMKLNLFFQKIIKDKAYDDAILEIVLFSSKRFHDEKIFSFQY
jgi:hypothetical protein